MCGCHISNTQIATPTGSFASRSPLTLMCETWILQPRGADTHPLTQGRSGGLSGGISDLKQEHTWGPCVSRGGNSRGTSDGRSACGHECMRPRLISAETTAEYLAQRAPALAAGSADAASRTRGCGWVIRRPVPPHGNDLEETRRWNVWTFEALNCCQ